MHRDEGSFNTSCGVLPSLPVFTTMANQDSIWAAAHDTSHDHEVLLSRERSPGVWVVTLHDPETHNTLTPTMMGAIARELDRLNSLESDEVKHNAPRLSPSSRAF